MLAGTKPSHHAHIFQVGLQMPPIVRRHHAGKAPARLRCRVVCSIRLGERLARRASPRDRQWLEMLQ